MRRLACATAVLLTMLSLGLVACSDKRSEAVPHSLLLEEHVKENWRYIRLTINGVTQQLNWIPGGEFWMGSPDMELHRVEGDEMLRHVTLTRGYWMADTETTQELWTAIVGGNPSFFKAEDRPVENVSWHDVQQFLERMNALLEESNNYRVRAVLPTEAQWEYACRAGTQTAFYWGDSFEPAKANYDNDVPNEVFDYKTNNRSIFKARELPNDATMPVKTFEPNAWGIYDMHGNVFEWTRDRWAVYSSSDTVDPLGPAQFKDGEEDRRALRGGAWHFPAEFSRCAYRWGDPTDRSNELLGFRFILEEVN